MGALVKKGKKKNNELVKKKNKELKQRLKKYEGTSSDWLSGLEMTAMTAAFGAGEGMLPDIPLPGSKKKLRPSAVTSLVTATIAGATGSKRAVRAFYAQFIPLVNETFRRGGKNMKIRLLKSAVQSAIDDDEPEEPESDEEASPDEDAD